MQHPERIKRFSIETYGEITFRLTNVIAERIIFVSRGITVLSPTKINPVLISIGYKMSFISYRLLEALIIMSL